jgi:hypothetical protein
MTSKNKKLEDGQKHPEVIEVTITLPVHLKFMDAGVDPLHYLSVGGRGVGLSTEEGRVIKAINQGMVDTGVRLQRTSSIGGARRQVEELRPVDSHPDAIRVILQRVATAVAELTASH